MVVVGGSMLRWWWWWWRSREREGFGTLVGVGET